MPLLFVAASVVAASKQEPSAADLFAQASASRTAGDLEAAADGYAAAIRLRPDMAEAYMNAGWVLSELGRGREAAADARRGL